jgi:hypothetical protein
MDLADPEVSVETNSRLAWARLMLWAVVAVADAVAVVLGGPAVLAEVQRVSAAVDVAADVADAAVALLPLMAADNSAIASIADAASSGSSAVSTAWVTPR